MNLTVEFNKFVDRMKANNPSSMHSVNAMSLAAFKAGIKIESSAIRPTNKPVELGWVKSCPGVQDCKILVLIGCGKQCSYYPPTG